MKQDWEIYRDTGILGAYRPEQVILRRSEDGGVETLFRDSTAKWEGDDLTRQRAMLVGGKCFLVTSVFPGGASATPTDKLLRLIDTKLVWGDRIFEKCGIGRDEGGDDGKTLEIRGKRRLSARDGGANYQQS